MFDFLKRTAVTGGAAKISPDQAIAMTKAGALIVDVREPSEIASTGKAKGAINIPVNRIAEAADPSSPAYNAKLQRDADIILYCASGMRSAAAVNALAALGFTKVYNLGNLAAWIAGGGTVESGSKI